MVDVSGKSPSNRTARASCEVHMQPETLTRIKENGFTKGNVIEVARISGIMATKRTADIIPLCHPIRIDGVEIDSAFTDASSIKITATVKTSDRTGVEMEALMAASAAGLVVYDMCKSVDRAMKITNLQLEEKTGGKSGDFRRN